MVVKSTNRAKSTVAGEEMIGTDVFPPCRTRAAVVISTENDSTLQMGASFPKTTSAPGGALLVAGGGLWLVLLPHPTITTIANPATSASKNTRSLLFMAILLEFDRTPFR
jgi:hypothetical protein